MFVLHCAQCGSELVASATHCQRCGRAVGGASGWATPKLNNLAQAVEQFRDEVKATPLPQVARPDAVASAAKQPLTLNAQWSAVPAEPVSATPAPDLPQPHTPPAPGFFPAMPSWGSPAATAPPLQFSSAPPAVPPAADVPAVQEESTAPTFNALPDDHWSRQVFTPPVPPVAAAPAPAPAPPTPPASNSVIGAPSVPPPFDLEKLQNAVDNGEEIRIVPRSSVFLKMVAVLVAVGIGVGISTFVFGRASANKTAVEVAPAADQLKDVELSGFRLKRLDGHSVQVKFLVVNHGATPTGGAKLGVTLRAKHDATYYFETKVPGVAPGELTEVTAKVDAAQTMDEAADWQKLQSEYKVIR